MWHDVDWVGDIAVYPPESERPIRQDDEAIYDDYDERKRGEKSGWTDLK